MLQIVDFFCKLNIAFPDLLSIASVFFLFILTNFSKCDLKFISKSSLLSAVVLLFSTLIFLSHSQYFVSELFIYNSGIAQVKIILFCVLCLFLIFIHYSNIYKKLFPTFFVSVYGLVSAINLSISSNSFLSLLLALELYTYSIAFLLEDRKCAVRFLLISAVMCASFLFGNSLLYLDSETLQFGKINYMHSVISIIGATLIVCSLLFKLGCVPFHSWLLDVYSHMSLVNILFLEMIWKPFMVLIFFKTISTFSQFEFIYTVIEICAITSMLVGSIMTIFQSNISKFVASISISHIGFVLTLIHIPSSFQYVMTYLAYYSVSIACFLYIFISNNNFSRNIEFPELSGLCKYASVQGFILILSLFATQGLPPFGNFFAKINLFRCLIIEHKWSQILFVTLFTIISIIPIIKWLRVLFKQWNGTTIVRQNNLLHYILLLFLFGFSLFYIPTLQMFRKVFASL